ncbi:MAG: DUF433 domain-containing protein [Deltaproteobacteria bacterium]|nr:DUF433 domain-containing protein [Deltaproteobacteria bacterium]
MNLAIEVSPVPLCADEHGVMRIGQTRVRLDTVISAWRQGESPEQIVENFDVLDLADVYAVISYYLHHRAEVEQYMTRNRQEGEQIRAEHEQRFPSAGIRERLLARRAAARNMEK